MATVCRTLATLTSPRVSTIFGVGASVENHVYTSAAYYTSVPHLCPFVRGAQDCDSPGSGSGLSLVPGELGVQKSEHSIFKLRRFLVFSPRVYNPSYGSLSKNNICHKFRNTILNVMFG